MWCTRGLHALAKAGSRPSLPIADKEQPRNDGPKEREWDRLRTRGVQRAKRRDLSRLSQIAETICGQAYHRSQLGACWPVEDALGVVNRGDAVNITRATCITGCRACRSSFDLTRWPGESAFAKQMDMQMRHAFTRVGPAVDHDAIAAR